MSMKSNKDKKYLRSSKKGQSWKNKLIWTIHARLTNHGEMSSIQRGTRGLSQLPAHFLKAVFPFQHGLRI